MPHDQSLAAYAVSAALLLGISGAQALDDPKYPDFKGQWARVIYPGLAGQATFDQTKPWGSGQQAPLTPEYQAVFEQSLADQAAGGQGNFKGSTCIADGMPLMMTAFTPLEFIITPETTYILVDHRDHTRRVYTDDRGWPAEIAASFQGYSIGRWVDEDGDGRYDVLEVETRGPFKGPRVYDATGLPLHYDNMSSFKERIFLDKANPNLLHDEITVFDHALTRPWTVDKRYRRNPNPRPEWEEYSCPEANTFVFIGGETYYLSGESLLMPTKKDQPAPDLKHFTRK